MDIRGGDLKSDTYIVQYTRKMTMQVVKKGIEMMSLTYFIILGLITKDLVIAMVTFTVWPILVWCWTLG
jgi:hypothetical protein